MCGHVSLSDHQLDLSFDYIKVNSSISPSSEQTQEDGFFGFKPTKLFVFGDSYADTGNTPFLIVPSWRFPNGITFPGIPTGRFSDGRVSTDYLAKYIGVRTPITYKWGKYGRPRLAVKRGMNFAYGGAGAFETMFKLVPTASVQIDSFEQLLMRNVYSPADLNSSVAFFSIIGNDYLTYDRRNGSEEGRSALTRKVVKQILLDVKRIKDLGVRKVLVALSPPQKCLPKLVTPKGCDTNDTSTYLHNSLLRKGLIKLNDKEINNNDKSFMTLDLYNAFVTIFKNKGVSGVSTFPDPFKACCATKRGLIFPMRSPAKTMPSMSPSSVSTEKSPPPSDTSMAIVAFDNSTTHFSSSPSPPHSLDHSSESEKEDAKSKPESRRNKNPGKVEETPSPIVVVHNHNRSVKEVVPTRKSARVGSGRSSGQRSGAVSAILRRSRREEVVKFSALGFRLSEVVLALISFSIMAADKTKGWSGDSFDRYKEYRFCLSVNVVAFVYSSFQACDLAYHLVKEKHLISHHLRPLFEFIIDQVLAYLLMSASTAAVTRVDDWVSNWGKDEFTEMASASIAMSFLAFLAFAFSSLISGYNLFNQGSL